jgi:transposase-like protein
MRSLSEVAKKHGMTRQFLVSLFQQDGLIGGGGQRVPSPEEIRQECLLFRRRWTPEQRAARWVGSRRVNHG